MGTRGGAPYAAAGAPGGGALVGFGTTAFALVAGATEADGTGTDVGGADAALEIGSLRDGAAGGDWTEATSLGFGGEP